MTLLPGTLRHWLLSNPKPWEVQSVFRQLFQGLAYMHDHGVVHRDIKYAPSPNFVI
jgi:serine/threonine protein kinase